MRLAAAAWILAAAPLAAQIVEGRVVNALTGAGIASVTVSINPVESTLPRTLLEAPAKATTDAEGRFRVAGVRDGVYRATYKASGFWPIPGALGTGGQPAFLVAAGGETVRTEVRMQPIGRLAGRVLDDSGKSVPNADLWLTWTSSWCKLPACVGFRRQAKTGAKGEYNIADVDIQGSWLVSATPPASWPEPKPRDGQRLGWAQTFYPGTHDLLGAQGIPVRAGSEYANLDIKLAAVPVRRVRGIVIDERGHPVPKAAVVLGKDFGQSLQQETGSDGAFEFVFASAVNDEWHVATRMSTGGINLWAAKAVTAVSGDLKNVELRLAPPFSIAGKTVMEGAEGVSASRIPRILTIYAGAGQGAGIRLGVGTNTSYSGAKGQFTIRNVYPGPYLFLPAEPPPPLFYLDSIRLGDINVLGSGAVMVSAPQPLTVTYKTGGGTVRGTVEACAGGDAFLVPQDPALRHVLLRRVTCMPNGQVEFRDVRPGDYYGFAVAGDSSVLWQEAALADAAVSQAARVSVRPGESTTAGIRVIQP